MLLRRKSSKTFFKVLFYLKNPEEISMIWYTKKKLSVITRYTFTIPGVQLDPTHISFFIIHISPNTHPSNELVYILSHIILNQIFKVVHNCSLYMHSPNDNFNLMFLKSFSISVDECLCRSFSHSGCNASLLSRAFQSALFPFASKVFCY